MSRRHCPTCAYPLTNCLCAAVHPVVCRTQIDVLQHPREAKAAKNSVRLLKLCLKQQLRIWPGENADDFKTLQNELGSAANTALLYPGDSAAPLSALTHSSQQQAPLRLLLIDATWRKAYKMWQLNPWLHTLPRYELCGIDSNYERKTSIANALSSLECVRHALALLEPELELSALDHVFAARQQQLRAPG
ncbi:DTW domain-containing protein [Agaribacterium haliotis]|uniref:DTW domain-containing protein n=1 Tax=Agaribacterium haliotis TaxID=2013869 RepID=UPI0013043390|nr:tRNA-uridine aminocarboxypropyltransferase [Agaribacterium haliotis]